MLPAPVLLVAPKLTRNERDLNDILNQVLIKYDGQTRDGKITIVDVVGTSAFNNVLLLRNPNSPFGVNRNESLNLFRTKLTAIGIQFQARFLHVVFFLTGRKSLNSIVQCCK